MEEFSNITDFLKRFVDRHNSLLVNIFFWFFLISFLIDRIINYFFHFPFFVVSAIILFPFLFLAAQYKNPEKRQLIVLVFSFLAIVIINSIVHLFALKNISDFLFIGLFITFYFYYCNNISSLRLSNIYIFFILCLFLFSFTFLSINSNSISKTEYTTLFGWEISSLEKSELLKEMTNKKEIIKWKPDKLDILEYFRVYHNGLFRIPHIASYFFGFLFLFFTLQYQKKKKIIDIVLLIVSLVLCFYTGSRAILAALVLSVLIFLFRKRYLIYFSMLTVLLLVMIIANDYLMQLTEDTIFYQYFTFIQTSTENFTRLSRFRLWYSWWLQISEFGFWDIMIGKSFINALIANAENLDYKVWFHNDFLNIFYSYGIWCTALYIWFFIKIYRDNKVLIRRNLFIFVFYSSMVITALVNGFYYYFPVFLLYLFFVMIRQEQETLNNRIISITN